MKKLIVVIFLFGFLSLDAQIGSYLFYKLKGIKDKEAVLYSVRGNEVKPIDTAQIQQNGAFVFTNIDQYPAGMYSVRFNDSVFTEVIFNKETIVLEANYENVLMTMDVKKSLENKILFGYWKYAIEVKDSINQYSLRRQKIMQKSGGVENKQSLKLQSKINRLDLQIYKYIEDLKKAYPTAFAPNLLLSYQIPTYKRFLSFKDNNPYASEMEFYWNHFFDNIDFSDARFLNTKVLWVSISDYMKNFGTPASTANYIKIVDKVMSLAYANTEVYNYCMFLFVQNFDNTVWEDVFVHIVKKYMNNSYAVNPSVTAYYLAKAERILNLKPGKKAPNIIAQNLNGEMVNLYDIKAKAKVIIFYSSDCPHCQEAMPDFKKLYAQYKDQDVAFIGFAIDEGFDLWKKDIAKNNLEWTSLTDGKGLSSPVVEAYNIWMTPTIYILSKDNVIMKKPRSTDEVHATLLQLIY